MKKDTKNYICSLFLCLVLVCSSIVPSMASAYTLNISKTTAKAHYSTWWHDGNGGGWTATKYAQQYCYLTTIESGYSIKVGLQTANNASRYPIFLSSSNYTSTTINKSASLQYDTASYKPYVSNNSNTTMTIKDNGYFKFY